MKKVIAFFGILCLFINCLIAQITFEKSYRQLNDVEIAKSCDLTDDGGFIIASGEKSVNNTARFDAILKLNAWGDTVWYTQFQILSNSGNLQFVRNSNDGGYYLLGVREDSTGDHQFMIWLAKYNNNGNIVWLKNYTTTLLNASTEGNTIKVKPDGSLFMWLKPLSLINYSTAGFTHQSTSFYNPNNSFVSKNNLMLSDTNFYYLVTNNLSNTYRVVQASLIGNINTSIVLNVDTGSTVLELLKKTSTSYYTTSFSNQLIGGKSPFMVSKFDSIGTKNWNKFYDFIDASVYYRNVNLELANKTNIVSFTPVTNGFNPPTGRASIFCFNNNGDSLWYKQLSPSDTSAKTEIFDVIATPDSGLLAVGQIVFSNGQQKSYMIKLDANGNLFNPMKIVERKKETYLHVYPNPATNYTGLHYMGIEKNALLTISDLQGKQVFSKQLETNEERIYIDTSVLDAGFYICSISVNGEKSTSKKLVVIN